MLKQNIDDVIKRVENAALRSGRNYNDITIIAVTKKVEIDRMKKIVDMGIVDLGENRVQELCEKFDNIDRQCLWHLIGHLQTNKVKYIIEKVKMIHSVDNLGLAQEIQRKAYNSNKVVDILVQVNIAEEKTKFGINKFYVNEFLKTVSEYKNIRVKGLMTIAPFVKNPESIRWVFKEMKKLFVDIKSKEIKNINMDFLSMGMSNDFEIAIQEGANMVRIGTALFGDRII